MSVEQSDLIRPLDVISCDLKTIEQQLALLDREFQLWSDACNALPPDTRSTFTKLLDNFSQSSLSEEFMSDIPNDLSRLLYEYASLSSRAPIHYAISAHYCKAS